MLRRILLIFGTMACLLLSGSPASPGGRPQASGTNDESTIWNLEHAYWNYVQTNDLPDYLALFDKNFVGWPGSYPTPGRKDQMTDWITRQTNKGLSWKIVYLKPAGAQVTGNVAAVCYWITFRLEDKDGKGTEITHRIAHTWVKNGKDWQIIAGMSMPESPVARK